MKLRIVNDDGSVPAINAFLDPPDSLLPRIPPALQTAAVAKVVGRLWQDVARAVQQAMRSLYPPAVMEGDAEVDRVAVARVVVEYIVRRTMQLRDQMEENS